MRVKGFLYFIISVLVSASILVTCAFILTRGSLSGVDTKKEKEPYNSEFIPDDTDILFTFDDAFGVALSLSFSNKNINSVIIKDPSKEKAESYGFKIDYICQCGYSFIMNFIDAVGGVELTLEEEPYLYTGVQICNILATNTDSFAIRIDILEALFNQIAKNALPDDALLCIIEETKSTLSYPAVFGWNDCIDELCISYNIINER